MIPEPVGKPTDSPSDEAQREDARVAYSSAIALWAYEGESAWSRFNAMLVANSILLAFIGFLYGSDNPPKLPILAVAVFGILFCAVWWVITVRAFDHQSYWVLSARELEERYLSPTVRTVARGGEFARGRRVELIVDGNPVSRRVSWPGRLARVSVASNVIIGGFVIMYGLLIIWLQ